MRMAQRFDLKLISHKSKVPTKGHNEILDILNNLILYNSFIYILNVSSIAAYAPGPLMATYYASKAYVLRLSQSIYGELRRRGSHVHVAALCPGPVRTEFNQVAGVEFFTSGMSAQKAAKIAIDGMFSEKREIIPGAMMKWVRALTRVAPTALQLRVSHYLQHRKTEKSS